METAAWKRAKIIHGLMVYRRFIAEQGIDDLIPLKVKMAEIVMLERSREQGHETIDEVEGVINPRESDAIQQFRRQMRRMGLKSGTERAYVGKVKAFMAARGLNCLADFDLISGVDQSKGDKSRLVPLPEQLVEPLRRAVRSRAVLHEQDLADGTASVWMPHALGRKYPSAHRELKWQFLFASHRLSRDPRSGRLHRHHIREGTFSEHLRRAVSHALSGSDEVFCGLMTTDLKQNACHDGPLPPLRRRPPPLRRRGGNVQNSSYQNRLRRCPGGRHGRS